MGHFQNKVTVTPRLRTHENLIISWSTSYITTTESLVTHLSIVIPQQCPYFHRIHILSQTGGFQNKVIVFSRPKTDENLIISLSTSYNSTTVSLITYLSIIILKQFPYFHRIHEFEGRNPISPPQLRARDGDSIPLKP